MYMFLRRSAAKSLYLWSSPILGGHSSRHPWSKLQLPIFHPREALLVGPRVTALPSFSCGILSLSLLEEVVLHGVGTGTSVLCMMVAHTQGNATSDMMRRSSFGGGLVTICAGSSLRRRAHQLWFVVTPPKSLLPPIPWSSSFPSRHLPSLVPGHQVSNSLCLFFCHSIVSCWHASAVNWACASAGHSSIGPTQKWHTHPHS